VRKRTGGSGKAKIELEGQEVEIPASTVAEVEEWLRDQGVDQEYTFWRGMWQLGSEDWIEDETVRMYQAEDTEELCCSIMLGREYMEVLPRNVTDLYRQIEADWGLKEIYLKNDEGMEASYDMDLGGQSFTVFQHKNRARGVRALWPGETQHEWIKAGYGGDVKAQILKELATPAAIAVIKEGNIPVHRKLRNQEKCKDLELLIFPLGRLPDQIRADWDKFNFAMAKGPTFAQRRSYRLWKEERMERTRRCDEWFNKRDSRECEIYWKAMGKIAFKVETQWVKSQIAEGEPEDIRVEETIEQMHEEITKEIKPKASIYWKMHQETVGIIPKDQFKCLTAVTINRIHYLAWKGELDRRAGKWSRRRQQELTDILQRIDSTKSMREAENLWKETLLDQLFEAVDEEKMYQKAREIRAICTYIRPMIWNQATVTSYVRDHLAMYEDQRDWILNEPEQRILEEIMKTGDKGTQQTLWNRMLALVGATECSNTHVEYRIYKLWWIGICGQAEGLSGETEWTKIPDRYRWEGFDMDGHSLRKWVTERIKKNPGGQIPHILSKIGRVESVFTHHSWGVSQEEVQKKPQLGTTQ
jgi:hypothetical protein